MDMELNTGLYEKSDWWHILDMLLSPHLYILNKYRSTLYIYYLFYLRITVKGILLHTNTNYLST